MHFVIEFKDKGVHLHNLTTAVACGTLGKLTLAPSLGQVGEFVEQKCSACLVIRSNTPASTFRLAEFRDRGSNSARLLSLHWVSFLQKVINLCSRIIYPST